MAPERASRRRALIRLVLLALSLALIWLGADQYGLLRVLVRLLCPSCVGIA